MGLFVDGARLSASFYTLWGLRFDSAGDLYIADAFNNRIRKITISTGIVSTVAGNGATTLNQDGDFALGTFGGDGGEATSAALNFPTAVAFDSSGTFFFRS